MEMRSDGVFLRFRATGYSCENKENMEENGSMEVAAGSTRSCLASSEELAVVDIDGSEELPFAMSDIEDPVLRAKSFEMAEIRLPRYRQSGSMEAVLDLVIE